MPHGHTGQIAQDITEHHIFDRLSLDESASEKSNKNGVSGPYGADRPRGHESRAYDDSDLHELQNCVSRDDCFRYAGGASRGQGDHHATRRDDYPDSLDDGSLAADSVSPHSRGTRGHRGTVREHYESSDKDDLAVRGARGHSRQTRSHRGVRGESDDESFDDGSDSCSRGARGRTEASTRHPGPPARRGAIYPGAHAGPDYSSDLEAEHGGRISGLFPQGHDSSGGDSERRCR